VLIVVLAAREQNPALGPSSEEDRSDRLTCQTFVIAVLRDLGTRDPQARQQATEHARAR
jgi:hypothetical protein